MFRQLFLVLLTVYLVQGQIDYSATSEKPITRRRLNLSPSNRGRLSNAKPPASNGGGLPKNNPGKDVPIEIGKRTSSCKASSGAIGNCVKANLCTVKEIFRMDTRTNIDEEPCQDPTEVCCISRESPTPVIEEAPVTRNVQVTSQATPEVTEEVTPGVTPQAVVNCGFSNPNGVGTQTKGSGDVKKAKFGEFPWNVQLLDQNRNNEHVCGGAIIHPMLVMTAAHCLLGRSGNPPPRLLVRAGEWDRDTDSEELPHQDREVHSNSTHEEFVQRGLFNDIALLHLTTPFELAPHVGVVCLPLSEDTEPPKHYTSCLSSGWGKEANDQELQGVLKKLELPIVDRLRCTKHLRKTRLGPLHDIHRSFLCAGGDGRDNCEGDGGSPLVCPMPDHPGRFMLTGIVSWTVSCNGPSIPGLYSNVHKLSKWITEELFVAPVNLTGHQF